MAPPAIIPNGQGPPNNGQDPLNNGQDSLNNGQDPSNNGQDPTNNGKDPPMHVQDPIAPREAQLGATSRIGAPPGVPPGVAAATPAHSGLQEDFSGFQSQLDSYTVRSEVTSSHSRRTVRSVRSATDLEFIEMNQELERLQLKTKQEEEERQAKAEERRARAKADQEELILKQRIQRAQASRAGSSRAGSSRASFASSRASGSSVRRRQERIPTWSQDVARALASEGPAASPRGAIPETTVTPDHSAQDTVRQHVVEDRGPRHVTMDPLARTFQPADASSPAAHTSIPSSVEAPASTGALAEMCHVAQSLKELSQHSLLPPSKLSRFSGDVLEYADFKQSFQWKVERNVEDSKERLHQLMNHLDGFPKEKVSGCRFMQPSAGYADAWSLLDKEYGSTFKLEKAYVSKLLDWKRIEAKDVDGLKRFGAFLGTVLRAMGSNLRTLDSGPHLEGIARKLPPVLLGRWSRIVERTENEVDRPVDFKMLAEFVEKEARVADVSSRLFDGEKKLAAPKKERTTTKSFSILTEPASKPEPPKASSRVKKKPEDSACKACGKTDHNIFSCAVFQGKSVEERRAHLRERKAYLCYRCLQKPYKRGAYCSCRATCSECGGAHHRLLCDPSRPSSAKKTTPSGGGEEPPAAEPPEEVKHVPR